MNTNGLRTWLEINIDNIKYNFLQIKRYVRPGVKIMCVVKADAYGHGAVFLSRIYESLGCDYLAVSNIDEATQIRKARINLPILILGFTHTSSIKKLIDYKITQTVMSFEFAEKLSEAAENIGEKIKVHIKIDTGMNRLGFLCEEDKTVKYIKKINALKGLELEGIFTHFSCADDENFKNLTTEQFEGFKNLVRSLEEENVFFKIKHCSNSAAILKFHQMCMDMIRPGIILYGLMPSDRMKKNIKLKPVMSWKAAISQIKIVKKNKRISYGGTFTTKKDSKIATIPVGYADGYPRLLSNKGIMTVLKKNVFVVGRVCMDQLLLDVSSVSDIKLDDIVTIFDGNIDELSKLCSTINYEFCCNIGKRVSRIFIQDGKIVEQLNYICK